MTSSSLYSLHSIVMITAAATAGVVAAATDVESTISATGAIRIESNLPPLVLSSNNNDEHNNNNNLDILLQSNRNNKNNENNRKSPSEELLKALLLDGNDDGTTNPDNKYDYGQIKNDSNNNILDYYCTLYLAQSTIPGAGLGIFAGNTTFYSVNKTSTNTIPSIVTTPDIVVPLIDMAWHNDLTEFTHNEFIWDEYTWDAGSFNGMNEPDLSINGASFGYGAIPNSLQAIINAKDQYGTIFDYHPDQITITGSGSSTTSSTTTKTTTTNYKDVNYDDGEHNMDELVDDDSIIDDNANDNDNTVISYGPGYGAYTQYYNRTGVARRIIQPGEEIFINYGEDYFINREHTYGMIPVQTTYTEADKLLSLFYEINDELNEILNIKQKKSIQQHQPNDFNITNVFYEMIQSVLEVFPSRLSKVVTTLSLDEANTLRLKYGSLRYRYTERNVRDIGWLHQHGSCMDKLIVQPSTVPHAGRGAFTKRNIAEGEVIAPIPVIHIPNRTVLNMYGGSIVPNSHGNKYKRNVTDLIHYQLLLNYCYGHRHSTLLLCPYGVASSAINHAPTPDQINAIVRWNYNLSSHPEWLRQPLSDWVYKYKSTGLVMEYVATRPIGAGEEILIDYGTEWDTAWQNHVQQWNQIQPEEIKNRPLSSRILNRKLQYHEIELPTVQEVWEYPNLHLYCRNIYPYFTNATIFKYRYQKKLLHTKEYKVESDVALPCRIVSKYRTTDVDASAVVWYNVELLYRHHARPEDLDDEDREFMYDDETDDDMYYTEIIDMCYEIVVGVVFNVPSSHIFFGTAINWYDIIYDRSYHNTKSFRHDLRIPDTIMPDVWKNLQKQQQN